MTDDYLPIEDGTLRGDVIAEEMRIFYEANRESWWFRRFTRPPSSSMADNLMLGLMGVCLRAHEKYTPRD